VLNQFRSSGELFRESVIRTLLKASLSVCTFFYKFLSVEMVQELLVEVLPLPEMF